MTTQAKQGARQGHTEGPWEVVDEHYIESKLHNIAKIYGPQIGRNGRSKLTKEQAEANARLIAAAPDLLKALKACQVRIFMELGSENTAYQMAAEAIDRVDQNRAQREDFLAHNKALLGNERENQE